MQDVDWTDAEMQILYEGIHDALKISANRTLRARHSAAAIARKVERLRLDSGLDVRPEDAATAEREINLKTPGRDFDW